MFNRNTFATHRRYITPFSIATAAVLTVAFTFVVSCALVGCNLKGGGTVGSTSDSLTYKTLCIDSTHGKAHQKTCLLLVAGGNTDAVKRINDSLAANIGLQAGQSLRSIFKRDDNIFKQYADEVADEKENNNKDLAADPTDSEDMPNWENTDTTLVLLNRGGVFSVAYQTYEYSGGAHGGESVTYRNFETATGKQLTLTDLFQPNYTVELTKIAERYFRKQFVVGVMNEKENAKLGELGFWFDSNMNADESVRFALNDNFCLTREGLRFTYNQYEITAYAVGMPEFCIPYSELRTLAKAGSVLETLTK